MSREYRFLHRGADGGLLAETELICLDDEGALLLADRMALGGAIEVWDGERLVGVAPTVAPAPPPVAAIDEPEPTQPIAPVVPPPRHKPFWSGAWRRGAPD
jgi:hypothetical protein